MPTNSSKRPWFVRAAQTCILLNCAYRPERWEAIPEAIKAMPSVFGNLLTFISGAHACIGYRFAVIE